MARGRCVLSNAKQAQHQRPTHVYKGRCKGCHAVLASSYDLANEPKLTAEMVAEMIRDGLAVTHEVFPGASMGECTCPKPERQESLFV